MDSGEFGLVIIGSSMRSTRDDSSCLLSRSVTDVRSIDELFVNPSGECNAGSENFKRPVPIVSLNAHPKCTGKPGFTPRLTRARREGHQNLDRIARSRPGTLLATSTSSPSDHPQIASPRLPLV